MIFCFYSAVKFYKDSILWLIYYTPYSSERAWILSWIKLNDPYMKNPSIYCESLWVISYRMISLNISCYRWLSSIVIYPFDGSNRDMSFYISCLLWNNSTTFPSLIEDTSLSKDFIFLFNYSINFASYLFCLYSSRPFDNFNFLFLSSERKATDLS